MLAPVSVFGQFWPQWMVNSRHTGTPAAQGQNFNRILVNTIYDPTVPQEQAATGGDLLAHYQAPLIDGDNVFMEFKSGIINVDTGIFATLNWGERGFRWNDGQLVQTWSYQSDWKAPGSLADFWEPVFHAALANGSVYVPGASGSIIKLDPNTGAVRQRISPFGTNANTYETGPITVDRNGNLYYNVVQIVDGTATGGSFYDNDPSDSFLVKVSPSGAVLKVSYKVLTSPEAPKGTDLCLGTFTAAQLPWPPSPIALPASIPCGSQRSALNIAPAVAPDGTIYGITRAHHNSHYGYLVAINPNLTKQWAASTRLRFHDGCGVPVAGGGILPANGTPGGCRAGTQLGVDPSTNLPGDGRILDDSSSTPAIAPDGAIFYGAYSRYNYAQGHMMKFARTGQFLKAYGFGWDETPAIFRLDGRAEDDGCPNELCYSLAIKDNHYGNVGSYCNDAIVCPPDRNANNPASPEQYFITQLDQNLNIQWQFKSTNTQSCTRKPDGTVSCVSDHPHGFEWCVNGHSVDQDGVVYVNSEDGNLYAIKQGGLMKDHIFQQLALGAAYTPTSMDAEGRIYSQNAGRLFVVGR